MRIAAHTKGGYGGVPQDVGKEFESADDVKPKKSRDSKIKSMYKKKKGA